MKLNCLLLATAVAAVVSDASAFKWTPVNLYPNPSADVSSTYFLENLNFNCTDVEGVAITEVMPVWIDEDGNEIKAVSGEQNPWGFDPTSFVYKFDVSDFKSNGEYILSFPEGLLVNASGEKSDKIETPYTFDIPELAPAMFDDFEILSLSPDLSQPQAIWNDEKIVVNTNHNDAIGLATLQVIDETAGGESMFISSNYSTGRELGDDSEISWNAVGSFKFFEGHVYKANFVFYNGKDEVDEMGTPTKIVDRISFEFTGKVEGYKYSDITLLSVTPEPYSIVISEPSQAVFTYEFSGPVNVYQAASPLGQNGMNVYPSSCLSSNEDKTVWTLDLKDDSYVNSVDALLTIYVYVRDLDGYQLKGDFGEESESCFTGEWVCDLGAKPIEVVAPVAGESLDRLTEIVVKSANGEPMAWSWNGEAKVVNILGETIGTLVYDQTEGEEDAAAVEISFTRWMDKDWNVTPIDLVKEGSYAVVFGPGCFVFGDQFESVYSRSVTSMFSITGVNDTPDPVVDPSEQEVFIYDRVEPTDGSVVKSLDKIKLWYPEIVDTMGKDAIIYNKADQSVATTAQVIYDWDDLFQINVELFDVVSAAGEYEIVIPARAICTSEFFESDGKKGICNPEIRLSYTVDPEGNAVVSVSEASVCDVFDMQGRIVLRDARRSDINALPKGIYVAGGKKIVVK